jgi:ribosomal protein S18 acetylase RimI-like enzyme
MEIVKYNHSYAAEVAKMWNMSRDAWGGSETLKTEESVIKEESTKGYINLYLAIDEDEVVGYCGFSIYEGDKDTSYLPLLNVRPDYHGKKVGKLLVLKVIEDAIKSEYNRFDLYTWSGNIKAMPLYKKCGFMWEKKIDSVHLMNWLPYMMKTEAIKDYFEKLDWYKDNKREINSSYDGEESNEQTTFHYHFENDEELLKVGFDRSGRGINYIETNDYKITMSTPSLKLIYGNHYDVTYELVNKSGKKLNVRLEGISDESIGHEFAHEVSVKDKTVLTSSIEISKPKMKFDEFLTAPCAAAKIHINGKVALFKLGVNAVSPVEFKLSLVEKLHHTKNKYNAYLDIESNLDESSKLVGSFESGVIDIEDFEIDLKPKEKKSIKLNYGVNDYGVYSKNIHYNINGKDYSYLLEKLIQGESGVYHHIIEGNHYIVNNEYVVNFSSKYKEFALTHSDGFAGSEVMPIKLGEPFTQEFTNAEIKDYRYYQEGSTACLELSFDSTDFKGVKLTYIAKLYAKGMFELTNRLENVDYDKDNISALMSIYVDSNNAYIPYDGKILDTGRSGAFGVSSFDSSKIDENWIYFKKDHSESGICFDFDGIEVSDWSLAKKFDLENFKKGDIVDFGRIFASINHQGYKKFREFAIGISQAKEKRVIKQFSIEINDGNPIIEEAAIVSINNNVNTNDKGVLIINEKSYEVNSVNDFEVKVDHLTKKNCLTFKSDKINKKESKVLFSKQGDISIQDQTDAGKNVKVVSNGKLEFKACKDFFDSVYSLTWDGKELLNSTFPNLGPKSWWDFWSGGIVLDHHPLKNSIRVNDLRSIDEVTVEDNLGNHWTGLKMTSKITKEEKYSTTEIATYVLTLPGVDVVAIFSSQENNTGKYESGCHQMLGVELNRNEEIKLFIEDETYVNVLKNCYVHSSNMMAYQVGDTFVHFISQRKLENFDNSEIAALVSGETMKVADGMIKTSNPIFMIMSDEKYTEKELIDLKNIKFEVK